MLNATLAAQPVGRYSVLSWDAGGDPTAVGTFLYYRELPAGTSIKVDVGPDMTYAADNLIEGATYEFYVTAYNAQGVESEPSNTIQFTPLATTANAPLSNVLEVLAPVSSFTITTNEQGTLSPSDGPPPLEFLPAEDFSGKAVFTYQLGQAGDEPIRGWVSVLVAEGNRIPVALDGAVSVISGVETVIALAGTDADGDPLSFNISSFPANGSLTGYAVTGGTEASIRYQTLRGFVGVDSFSFNVNDGFDVSADATVSIQVAAAPNSAPTASGQSAVVEAGSTVAIVLSGTDPEGDSLTYEVVTGPQHGSLSGTPPDVNYTASAGYSGWDSFTFAVNDGELTSAPATVSIQVTAAPNSAPTASGQSAVVEAGSTVAIVLSGTDPEGDSLTYEVVTGPQHGSLSGTPPDVNYTASAAYSGWDSFQFVVRDGLHASQPAEVSITVNGTGSANAAPLVDAGRDAVVTMPGSAQARGEVSDDGLPGLYPKPLTTWKQLQGPAKGAAIQNDNRRKTKIRFKESGTYVFQLAATDGELTGSDELVIQVGMLSSALPPEGIISVPIEAESGAVLRPMRVSTDLLDPAIRFVSSSRDGDGRATYDFGIPVEGNYIVWCRVLTPSEQGDSFSVFVDGDESTRDIYDAGEGEFGDAWKWTALCGRGGIDRSEDYAYTVTPRLFHFTAGQHSLTFAGHERGTQLDRMVITNDPEFDPVLAEQFPRFDGVPTVGSEGLSLEWSAVPGRSYQLAATESLQSSEWVLLPEVITATSTRVRHVVSSGDSARFYSIVLLP